MHLITDRYAISLTVFITQKTTNDWRILTGVGEVDVVRQIFRPEGTLVDSRSAADRST